MSLLQAAQFDEAEAKAREIITTDPENSPAHAVVAIVVFKRTIHQLIQDVLAIGMSTMGRAGFNHQYARYALENADAGLAKVDEHLQIAGTDAGFALRLCPACWRYDWNHSGSIDWRDEKLFQVEQDANGNELPEQDPRRTPTFRFDLGDVYWARAWIGFQRAVLNTILAYRWTELDKILQDVQTRSMAELVITIRIEDKARIARVKGLILSAFEQADLARQSYLAEDDDDHEWLPNPRQKNHALPLPVDAALYETWAGVLGDVTRLVQGKEGLSVAEIAQLGDHQWPKPPTGFIDIGKLIDQPGDLVFRGATLETVDHAQRDDPKPIEQALTEIFGEKYVQQMPASPLVGRLHRMKSEIERGEEPFERKLRYLLWLN